MWYVLKRNIRFSCKGRLLLLDIVQYRLQHQTGHCQLLVHCVHYLGQGICTNPQKLTATSLIDMNAKSLILKGSIVKDSRLLICYTSVPH